MAQFNLGTFGLVDSTTHQFRNYYSGDQLVNGTNLYQFFVAQNNEVFLGLIEGDPPHATDISTVDANMNPVSRPLSAGTYYVRVNGNNQIANFGFTVVPNFGDYVDDPGETASTALNLGTLSSTISHSDAFYTLFARVKAPTSFTTDFSRPVQQDQHDFYKFHLDAAGAVTVNFSGGHGAFILMGPPQGNLGSQFAQTVTSGQPIQLTAGDYTLEVVDSVTTATPQGAGTVETRNSQWENYETYSFTMSFTAGTGGGGGGGGGGGDGGTSGIFTFNGHRYQYVSFNGVQTSWAQARDAAVARGGYLATITSQAENDFILQNVVAGHLTNGISAAFIGASDAGHEGNWQWATGPEAGTTFWNGGAAVSGQYARWRAGEPSNATSNPDGAENYGVFEGDGTWNDVGSSRGTSLTPGYLVEFSTPAPTRAPSSDTNADGRSDILWRNDSGQVYGWLMNGLAIGSEGAVRTPDRTWHIQDTGDFGGDGRSDVLWRNDNGQVYIWQMNGNAIASEGAVRGVDRTWHVQDTGDFNGDGKSDVLWRNDSGQVYIWQMNGLAIQTEGAVRAPDPSWRIEGTGDFDGDGNSDVLWRNTSGQVYIWEMNGLGIRAEGAVRTPDNSWRIQDTGDYNGDGRDDVSWRNDNGQVYVWLMNGLAIQSEGAVRTPDNSWHMVGHHYDLV